MISLLHGNSKVFVRIGNQHTIAFTKLSSRFYNFGLYFPRFFKTNGYILVGFQAEILQDMLCIQPKNMF